MPWEIDGFFFFNIKYLLLRDRTFYVMMMMMYITCKQRVFTKVACLSMGSGSLLQAILMVLSCLIINLSLLLFS